MNGVNLAIVSVLGVIAMFFIVKTLLEPLCCRLEDAINRWLCWREIRRAGR